MSKYYYLIAGLPTIALDDSKLVYSVAEFRDEIDGMLSRSDKKLIDLFFLKFDNKNLFVYLNNPEFRPDPKGSIRIEAYEQYMQALKYAIDNEEKLPQNKQLPPYIAAFIRTYVEEELCSDKNEQKNIPWEDRLSALYYDYAMKCGNRFVTQWYELNLNINNILTAFTCRKYGLDKADYIVGDNQVARSILSSNARDFGLDEIVDYLPELQRIVEEQDLSVREKKKDLLKWKWLDDNTLFKVFDIECVFAYMLKLEMIERWVTLDKATGEKTFRQIVGAMKKGSVNALEEFKRNNNR